MVQSSWQGMWHEDFDRVVDSMSTRERASLQRWGVRSIEGRRIFVSASDRLKVDVIHACYLMEQAALRLES
jgi:hypothetical protein